MRCPFCSNPDTQVKDSRPTEDNAAIRRRRFCPQCGARFTTFERVQLRELTVIKSDGKREPFDRDKIMRSMQVALRKRPVDLEHIDRVVNSLVRELESSGDSEIKADQIGEAVMDKLANLDQIAFVRYASVYKDFREVADFEDLLESLGADVDSLTGGAKSGKTSK
ncbi:MAG: transcriptional regulator NrdR [Pseudomonadota bacterium]